MWTKKLDDLSVLFKQLPVRHPDFETVFEAADADLFAFIETFLRVRFEAVNSDTIARDTITKVWHRYHNPRATKCVHNLNGYCRNAARNIFLNKQKKQKIRNPNGDRLTMLANEAISSCELEEWEADLSPAKRQLLELIKQGKSKEAIAARLMKSTRTIYRLMEDIRASLRRHLENSPGSVRRRAMRNLPARPRRQAGNDSD